MKKHYIYNQPFTRSIRISKGGTLIYNEGGKETIKRNPIFAIPVKEVSIVKENKQSLENVELLLVVRQQLLECILLQNEWKRNILSKDYITLFGEINAYLNDRAAQKFMEIINNSEKEKEDIMGRIKEGRIDIRKVAELDKQILQAMTITRKGR